MEKIIYKILEKLNYNGYEAYIVGGYVRDKILGLKNYDVDICTNAKPENVKEIFNLTTPEKFGCIHMSIDKYSIDMTTYRLESNYSNRKPSIKYTDNLYLDLERRDFTINSILMNKDEKIIDCFDGLKDLKSGIIKCIGNTNKKLTEDPLRILRAIRFSIIYNFKIDEDIINFLNINKELIKTLSYDRKLAEIDRIISSKNNICGLKKLKELDMLDVLEINYNDIVFTEKLGIYAQIEFSNKYVFKKKDKLYIEKIRELLKLKTINKETLYRYGLDINLIVADILKIKRNYVVSLYNSMPIRTRKDVNITYNDIVNLKDICYNNINSIYDNIEINILNGNLKNNLKDILKFLEKK